MQRFSTSPLVILRRSSAMGEGPLIGREPELLALEQALGASRVVTLTGVGGSGKTRLARELAARLAERPGAPEVVVVELSTVRAAEHVVDAMLRAAGSRERAGHAPGEVLLRRFAQCPALIVIDNCEHVVAEVRRLVTSLLAGAPTLRVLATSREPVDVDGEQVVVLSPLGLPAAGAGDVAAVVRADAGRFFVDRAAAVDPGFALTPATARAVVRICHELDGLPLALAIAASRTAQLTPGEIADGLSRRGRLEGGNGATALPQHRSVRASLDWSYGLLTDAERALFRRLATFAGTWDRAAARAVALPGAGEMEIDGLLGSLAAKGLIRSLPDAERGRWGWMQTVSDYAAEQLALDGEESETARDRHLAWYRALAAGADGLLLDPEGPGAIERETANLRLALARALDRDPAVALEIVASLLRHWILAERFEEGAAATARVLATRARGDDAGVRAVVQLGAALIATLRERYPEAAESLQRGLALIGAVSDATARAWCLQMAAMVLILTGIDPSEGVRSANLAADLMRSSGDALGLAWVLVNVAMAEGICDRFDAARNAYDEFLTVPGAPEHARLRTWAELAAAWTELIVGSPEQALAHAELALELEGDWPSMTHFILAGFRAHALALLGRTDEACAAGERELARAHASGTVMAAPGLEMALAIAELMAGELDRAEARASGLLAMPQVHTLALTRELLARIALSRGDPSAAAVHGRELGAIAERSDSPRHRAVAEYLQGCAAALEGAVPRGRDLVQDALAIHVELGVQRGVADCLEELGLMAAAAGDGTRAARLAAAAARARARLACAAVPATSARLADARERFAAGDGGAAWEAAWQEGHAMALTEAIAYARRSRGPRGRPSSGLSSLTPTELAAARLAATGISNPEIATRLFIARSTVKMHLSNVYLKLGVANRTELAATMAAQHDGSASGEGRGGSHGRG
jgi:predicted ATPase/DNA-binding CsgD family transcriptional regulator